MRWALITHPDQVIRGKLVIPPRQIPEDSIPIAVSQGWIVLGKDSEIPYEEPRVRHGYGWSEDDGA